MESRDYLVGILGLQITTVAGLMEVADAIGTTGEGFWFIAALIGILVTISGLALTR
ncbi:hypothetical protein [Natronococcus roseus]|uniref:hypothetical protein n=1 Tax=Natronococcus roseus TaxID=1052014 RepID=UPI00374DF164